MYSVEFHIRTQITFSVSGMINIPICEIFYNYVKKGNLKSSGSALRLLYIYIFF